MNSKRHFYLYAKGHYKQGDLKSDLLRIQSHYCGFELDDSDFNAVYHSLLELAYQHVKDHEYKFKKLIQGLVEFPFIDIVFADPNKKINYDEALVNLYEQLLSVLRFVKVFDLGYADQKVLPLSHYAFKRAVSRFENGA